MRITAITLAWFPVLLLSGCVAVSTGPLETESRSVDLGNAEMVRVELTMGAGELKVSGGASKLMQAEFQHNAPELKPDVRYELTGFRGRLTVQQRPGWMHAGGNYRNTWNLRLSNEASMDVFVKLGAGEGRLDLGQLALRGVEVEMGAGELKLDLRGKPKRSYDVSVRGGVGEATIYLPRDIGVVADVKGGIGGISARNLQKRDGNYVNTAYGESKVTIRLDVRGGIGAINLIGD